MNLFELIFFLVMIGLGVGSARVLYPVGGLWLAIPGFVFGFLLIPGIGFALHKYKTWAYLADQETPDCRCGSFKLRYEMVGEDFHLICPQCKTRYEKRRDQTWIYEGTQKKPYRRLVKHKGWI